MYKKVLFFLVSFFSAAALCSCDVEYTPYTPGQTVSITTSVTDGTAVSTDYAETTAVYTENTYNTETTSSYSDEEYVEWTPPEAETMSEYYSAESESGNQIIYETPQNDDNSAFRFVIQKGNNSSSDNTTVQSATPTENLECTQILRYGECIIVTPVINETILYYMNNTDTETEWDYDINITPDMVVYFSDGSSLSFDCDGSTIVSYYCNGTTKHICISQMFKSYLNSL